MTYYIIGSGGFAKEVYFLADQTLNGNYSFGGFIDNDVKDPLVRVRGKEVPVIDETDFLKAGTKTRQEISVFIGIGNPKITAKVSDMYAGFNFPNLIHPSFLGDSSITFGKGNIICAGCIFTVDIEIGNYNIFNLMCTVGHDARIGSCNIFNPGCNVSGGVKVGDNNLFGTNSTLLQYVEIGSNSTLGAASLANKNFGSNVVMIGSPAKPLMK